MSDLNLENMNDLNDNKLADLDLNDNISEIKRKGTMREKTRSIILIITFFIFLIIFTILYPYVLLFMNLKDNETQIFLSYFEKVFPVISAFAGVIIGYFIGYKKSE